MTNFDSRLQQELINLLIKLKNEAIPSVAKQLSEEIDLLKTKAIIPDQDFVKVFCYLAILAGDNQSLMNITLKKFIQELDQKNNLANQKKAR